jgi:hypothetical protein
MSDRHGSSENESFHRNDGCWRNDYDLRNGLPALHEQRLPKEARKLAGERLELAFFGLLSFLDERICSPIS